jgi:peptidoglycan biosynthesis protein MviN/MurJ (putative lipid II flippase)
MKRSAMGVNEAPTSDPQLERPAIVADAVSTARSSVVVSVSFLLANVFGGVLALLIALIVGEGPETDGFLAAYSAYLTFLLFGSTLRIALVPLLGSTADEEGFRHRAGRTVGRLVVAGAVMSGGLAASSPLLGRVLVPGAPSSAQVTAAVSMAILAVAAWCQIWAAALSAVLAASRRFGASAALYAGSSAGTVVVAALLMTLFGVVGAAVAVLGSALILVGGHVLYLRRFGFAVSPPWRAAFQGATWRLVVRAAAGASVPIAFQICLSITLAAVSDRPGAVTGYAYGYFIAVTISGVTSSTLGLTTMPQLVQALRDDDGGVTRRFGVMRNYLNTVAPFSVFLYLPLAAGYASFGRPFLDAVLHGSLQPDTIDLLWDVSRVFMLMALGWAVLAPVTTLALSLEMFGGIALVSAVVVAVQALLVAVASTHGPITVAGAHALSGTLLVVLVLALVFRREAIRALIPALARCLPAGAFALVFPALALAGLASNVALAALGLILGAALYLGLAVTLWPSVGGRAVRLLLSGT